MTLAAPDNKTMLHLVFASPLAQAALSDALDRATAGDSVLLLGDAVYALRAGPLWTARLADAVAHGIRVFALADDVACRGLASPLPEIAVISYAGFVDLAVAYPRSLSWV